MEIDFRAWKADEPGSGGILRMPAPELRHPPESKGGSIFTKFGNRFPPPSPKMETICGKLPYKYHKNYNF
ncbi:MAG: hypothetical protein LIP16_06730 [Clostridium sp.]|nr:hypothetical protein [Clostridium sp.]